MGVGVVMAIVPGVMGLCYLDSSFDVLSSSSSASSGIDHGLNGSKFEFTNVFYAIIKNYYILFKIRCAVMGT